MAYYAGPQTGSGIASGGRGLRTALPLKGGKLFREYYVSLLGDRRAYILTPLIDLIILRSQISPDRASYKSTSRTLILA